MIVIYCFLLYFVHCTLSALVSPAPYFEVVGLPTDPTHLPTCGTLSTWVAKTTVTALLPCFVFFCQLFWIGFFPAHASICSLVIVLVSIMVGTSCIISVGFHFHFILELAALLIACQSLYSSILLLLFSTIPSIPLPFHHFVYSIGSIAGILSFFMLWAEYITQRVKYVIHSITQLFLCPSEGLYEL